MIGITGTNGKTTTAYLVESILKRAGFKVGKISTIDYTLGGDASPSSITTPESQDLQGMLKAMVDRNLDYAVMEVSSHSLALHRVEGVEFDRAVFTNISPEHMDFHKNWQEYLETKVSLFEKLGKGARKRVSKKAIVNIDDPTADYLIDKTSSEVITYAVRKEADVRGRILEMTSRGVLFILEGEKKKRINLSLLGLHNVYNALEEDIPIYLIEEGLEEVKRIPGRLEPIDNKNGFNVFVDYAHTEDGLKKVLQTLQGIVKGNLIVVFGCGGDRDSQKRPLMGKTALKLADYSVITSDNPRSEDPGDIIAQIEKGIKEEGGKKGRDYSIVVDRKEAIKSALKKMQKGDTLLIAGKGHEKVQIFKDKVVEFDDRKIVRKLLEDY
jgi:UDP-N-acetylmuramoyl-L-alanyl-D-glutamate--2,6-diaminopimelate ligase